MEITIDGVTSRLEFGYSRPLVPHVSGTVNKEGIDTNNEEQVKKEFFAMMDEWWASRNS